MFQSLMKSVSLLYMERKRTSDTLLALSPCKSLAVSLPYRTKDSLSSQMEGFLPRHRSRGFNTQQVSLGTVSRDTEKLFILCLAPSLVIFPIE